MASDRIHLSGEEEKAKPRAGDPFWSGKGFAEVLWTRGRKHPCILPSWLEMGNASLL